MGQDIRNEIFRNEENTRVVAVITATVPGVIVGIEELKEKAKEIGVNVLYAVEEGSEVKPGDIIVKIEGKPKQIAIAEDTLLGIISKPSGVATVARNAVKLADKKITIVSGGWKKVLPEVKRKLRIAASIGGVKTRIAEHPFIYLDKNYVRIFGGIRQALEAVKSLPGTKVVQLKGETKSIEEEAIEAVLAGADIIMVDTGNVEDLRKVTQTLRQNGVRERVKVAFAGGVTLSQIPLLTREDVDILDIGRAVIDAPLLDVRLDVVEVHREGESSGS
ncbi:hypothetical protein [Thermococcus sp. LS2]|uniref:hypothetical protein n=1 Tax=Thermococcus sp. LS2 TaxID=1638260 RepID=UPI001438DA4D|nr:hypothetical protein [Thermococcus sp. LS2]NJE13158.1 hypothetical protein [Thermococcus sp. LS2]